MATDLKNDISPKSIDEQMYSEVVTAATLTAPNPGETINNASHFRYHYWQIDVAGGSGSIMFRPEGSLTTDGAFATMAADGEDVEVTADGSYFITTTRGIRASRVRLRVVSGTATSIVIRYRGGN